MEHLENIVIYGFNSLQMRGISRPAFPTNEGFRMAIGIKGSVAITAHAERGASPQASESANVSNESCKSGHSVAEENPETAIGDFLPFPLTD